MYTDVALDGESQSADALAAFSVAQRKRLRAAQRAQITSAAAACIESNWIGGFMALQLAVVRKQPSLRVPVNALALRVSAAAADECGEMPTRVTAVARIKYGEQLESRGKYNEAAACYKHVLDDDERHPGLLPTPAQVWSFYGLALKRAGRYAEAEAVYQATLAALPRLLRFQPDTPAVRDRTRLDLLGHFALLHWISFQRSTQLRARVRSASRRRCWSALETRRTLRQIQ